MASDLIETIKPRLRGWIHTGMAPLAVIGAIVLVGLAPTTTGKVSNAIFGGSAILLFGTSAVYHRGNWSPGWYAVLRRLDHANIFIIIAGTYTPAALLLLDPPTARTLLAMVWFGALGGLLSRVFWLDAPRWIYVPLYLALGWVAVGFVPEFWAAPNGHVFVWLMGAGGVAYSLGAVVYGLEWPDPNPRWFGFHEVFHTLTIVGFACHYVAVSIATYAAG